MQVSVAPIAFLVVVVVVVLVEVLIVSVIMIDCAIENVVVAAVVVVVVHVSCSGGHSYQCHLCAHSCKCTMISSMA